MSSSKSPSRRDLVRAAVARLQADGLHPSARAVRQIVGRGSLSDIARDLREIAVPANRSGVGQTHAPSLAAEIAQRVISALGPALTATPAGQVASAQEELKRIADQVQGQGRFVMRLVDDARAGERALRERVAALEAQLEQARTMAEAYRQEANRLRGACALGS